MTKFVSKLPEGNQGIDERRFIDIGRKLFAAKMSLEQKKLIMQYGRPKKEKISHEMQECKFEPNSDDPNKSTRRTSKVIDMYSRQMKRKSLRDELIKKKAAEKDAHEMS